MQLRWNHLRGQGEIWEAVIMFENTLLSKELAAVGGKYPKLKCDSVRSSYHS